MYLVYNGDKFRTWAARRFTEELKLARQAAGANCCVVMEDVRFNIALMQHTQSNTWN